MRKIWNKGHRIRASDKHLVYHFSIGTLLFVFVAVLLLLNIKQLMRADWEHFSLFENGLTLSPYNFITILIAKEPPRIPPEASLWKSGRQGACRWL